MESNCRLYLRHWFFRNYKGKPFNSLASMNISCLLLINDKVSAIVKSTLVLTWKSRFSSFWHESLHVFVRLMYVFSLAMIKAQVLKRDGQNPNGNASSHKNWLNWILKWWKCLTHPENANSDYLSYWLPCLSPEEYSSFSFSFSLIIFMFPPEGKL